MTKSKKIIVANWKMNPDGLDEAQKTFKGIALTASRLKNVETIVCPSFLHFYPLALKKSKGVSVGVQNIFEVSKGSYTGEVSVDMVMNGNASHVIIGHSERRKLGETNQTINKKVVLALKAKITPILCIGETTRDEEGKYLGDIKEQLYQALAGVSRASLSDIVIAYEPVWAIGASAAMEAPAIHEMTIFIKKTLIDMYKIKAREIDVPILYGGSVDPLNAHGILTAGEADGLLIGRISLDAKAFGEILKIANEL